MYTNVLFVVQYSGKDRILPFLFLFMRLPCWPAEWKYSNYSFPGCPLHRAGRALSDAALLPNVKRSWHIDGQQGRS